MIATKKAKKKIPTIRKYDDGYFVDANNLNSPTGQAKRNDISGAAATASGMLGALQSPRQANIGLGTVQGALTGAAAGYKDFGLIGGGVGLVAGAAEGYFGAKNKQRQIDQQNQQFNATQLQSVDTSMTHTNVDPYGTQMYELGDLVSPPDSTLYKNAKGMPLSGISPLAANQNLVYSKNNPIIVEKRNGSIGQWGNDIPDQNSSVSTTSNNYGSAHDSWGNTMIPGFNLRSSPTPNSIHHNKYEDGDTIQGSNPNNQPQSDAVNTQQNVINIQKGELLIHPDTGKILQEFNGINPLTGGMFEPHSKGKKEESPNNFTLADQGLFVITKKTAGQYKDAVDNNDDISKKTVLMNIRNAKIAKQGGLKPKNYAYGDYVDNGNILPDGRYTTAINPDSNNTLTRTPFDLRSDLTAVNPNANMDNLPNTVSSRLPTNSTVPGSSYQAPIINNTTGNILSGLEKYGPALVNLAQGTFGQTQTQPYARAAINPYKNQIESNLPKNIDMGPIISDIRSTQNTENNQLQNNTSNSAVVRANRQQISTNTNKALINARLGAQEYNNQVGTQRASVYNTLGQQDVQDQQYRRQYDLGVDDINARRTAAKQNLFNAGLSQLQQTSLNDKQNSQKAGLDKYSLDLMKQIFPNLKYYDDFDLDKVNKMLGR